jgi:hypothetical protein
MAPPITGQKNNPVVDFNAPFSEWEIQESFDSADACPAALVKHIHWAEDQVAHAKFETEATRNAFRWQNDKVKCIATEDPRLKGN